MLSEVLNREDHIKPPPKLTVAPNGDISFRAGEVKGSLPSKPEELRRAFKLMSTCWDFVRLKVPGKAYLKDHSAAMWDEHVDWLLGEEIYDFEVKDANKMTIFKPPWHQVLEIDYHVRRLAFKWVNRDGMSIKAALKAARHDEKTLRNHFTLPISVAAAAAANRQEEGGRSSNVRGRERSRSPHQRGDSRAKRSKSKGQGKHPQGGKGKGKGKNNNSKSKRSKTDRWTTPDGRQKCFAYNKEGCQDRACQRVHVCLRCGGAHPAYECTLPPSGGKGEKK